MSRLRLEMFFGGGVLKSFPFPLLSLWVFIVCCCVGWGSCYRWWMVLFPFLFIIINALEAGFWLEIVRISKNSNEAELFGSFCHKAIPGVDVVREADLRCAVLSLRRESGCWEDGRQSPLVDCWDFCELTKGVHLDNALTYKIGVYVRVCIKVE